MQNVADPDRAVCGWQCLQLALRCEVYVVELPGCLDRIGGSPGVDLIGSFRFIG